MTTLDVLRAARAQLSNSANWRRTGGEGPNLQRCVILTLLDWRIYEDVIQGVQEREARREATEALQRTLGLADRQDVFHWNDCPDTTHEDLLDALDRTIANVEALEAEMSEVEREPEVAGV